MTTPRKVAVIVNPCAAGGETKRRWLELNSLLESSLGPVVTKFTPSPGAAILIARELLREGYDLLVAVGGDGTINEVANGFFAQERLIRPEARLGILPMGTGGDFRRTLGIPLDPIQAAEILTQGVSLPIDVGKAAFQASDGSRETRYFVNMVSFGMGGRVAARSRNPLRHLGGKAAFLWATLETFLSYRGTQVKLRLAPEGEELPFRITNVAVGNGQYHGGGMRPCPTARLNDGIFEVTVIDYAGVLKLVRSLPVLYSGAIYQHPVVHHLRSNSLRAESTATTLLEVDGEALGRLPLQVSVLPQRLPVLVSASSPLLASGV